MSFSVSKTSAAVVVVDVVVVVNTFVLSSILQKYK
jgi:hypothetical protein